MISAVILDNGEPTLERCIASLRSQTEPLDEIVVEAGPNTNPAISSKADRVIPPGEVERLGEKNIKGILSCRSPYVMICGGDCIYDEAYAKEAVKTLDAGARAVRAGKMLPLGDDLLASVQSALLSGPLWWIWSHMEAALAFRREDFIDEGIHLDPRYREYPRRDVGTAIQWRMNPQVNPRMVMWTRLPTYHARLAVNYLPAAMGAAVPMVALGIPILSQIIGTKPFLGQHPMGKRG